MRLSTLLLLAILVLPVTLAAVPSPTALPGPIIAAYAATPDDLEATCLDGANAGAGWNIACVFIHGGTMALSIHDATMATIHGHYTITGVSPLVRGDFCGATTIDAPEGASEVYVVMDSARTCDGATPGATSGFIEADFS